MSSVEHRVKPGDRQEDREGASDPHCDKGGLRTRQERHQDAAEDASAVQGEARQQVESAEHHVHPQEIPEGVFQPPILNRQKRERREPDSCQEKAHQGPRKSREELLPGLARERDQRGAAAEERNGDVPSAEAERTGGQGVSEFVQDDRKREEQRFGDAVHHVPRRRHEDQQEEREGDVDVDRNPEGVAQAELGQVDDHWELGVGRWRLEVAGWRSGWFDGFEDGVAATIDDFDLGEVFPLDRLESGRVLANRIADAARLERPPRRLKEDVGDAIVAVVRRISRENIERPVHARRRAAVRKDHLGGNSEVLRIELRGLHRAGVGIDGDEFDERGVWVVWLFGCLAAESRGDEEADQAAAASHVQKLDTGCWLLAAGCCFAAEVVSHDLGQRESAFVLAAVAEAAGEGGERELRSAGDGSRPCRGKVADALGVVLDLVEKVVAVAFLAFEVHDEAGRTHLAADQLRAFLEEVEREFARHQLGAGLEPDHVPRAFGKMRRANRLRVMDLLDRVPVVYVEGMAGDVGRQPRRRGRFSVTALLEQGGGAIAYKERLHGQIVSAAFCRRLRVLSLPRSWSISKRPMPSPRPETATRIGCTQFPMPLPCESPFTSSSSAGAIQSATAENRATRSRSVALTPSFRRRFSTAFSSNS